ncbi:MAG: precorrin-8X methylmutase [Rhodospirillaceae bacterium]|nr:MAG: precorrin-8X methylmutase [Rhodospirillaceae bacterium]
MAYVYERDPQAIYRQSYATIEAEADLAALPQALRPVAIRMIHACGMTDLSGDIAWCGDPVDAARQALAAGAPVLCDAQMVAAGIIKRFFPATEIRCDINVSGLADLASRLGTTRSAAAVELWRDVLAGSIVVIGNAPTALFHLIEMIEGGGPKPAAIFGFPVGFVGAAESKDALIAADLDVPCLTLRGRRGGSAIAAAAINALSSEKLRGNL